MRKNVIMQIRCPRCGDPLFINIYTAMDEKLKATSELCEECGYYVNPEKHTGETPKQIAQYAQDNHDMMLGYQAQWKVEGLFRYGEIVEYLEPGYSFKKRFEDEEDPLLPVNLTGPKKSKFPRFLIIDENRKFHSIRTKQVHVILHRKANNAA